MIKDENYVILKIVGYKTRKKQREYGARRRATPGYKEKQAEYYRQWYRKNGRNMAEGHALKVAEYKKQHRLEYNVGHRFYNYVASGVIERPKYCSVCGGDGRINAHHPDYNKPFEVIWCCSSCHKRTHLGEDLGAMPLVDYSGCRANSSVGLCVRESLTTVYN